MRIAFFAPPKPINHKVPSGDLMIGKSLHDFLCNQGHEIEIASHMRMRNIMNKPHKWPALLYEYKKIQDKVKYFNPDIWLTYHSYYKAPDPFGARIARILEIPYAIYQGVFATKYRRNYKTWLGYMFNKNALIHADHVFANKEIDLTNLSRIILPEKLSRTYPGIDPDQFKFCMKSRNDIRKMLKLNGTTTIMSTAMLRNDVKADSVTDLINAFAPVAKTNPDTKLIIAGDGEARNRLESLAYRKAGNKIIFLGQIPRNELYKYYSAADLFSFPGINESLGMVYLEAQCCGLPIVAYSTRGPSEAVAQGETGLLSPQRNISDLTENILKLICNKSQRKQMSIAAPNRIKKYFNLKKNLMGVESRLIQLTSRR